MGNWFSDLFATTDNRANCSDNYFRTQNTNQRILQTNYNSTTRSPNLYTTKKQNTTTHQHNSYNFIKTPETIKINHSIMNSMLMWTENYSISNNTKGEIQFTELPQYTDEYNRINRLLHRNKKPINIIDIYKVYNPYLLIQYELNKRKYTNQNITFKEEIMFHGTYDSNVKSICLENFDWRLNGKNKGIKNEGIKNKGSKFGKGVNFSPAAAYATHYGDQGPKRSMIVAKVLIGKCCNGQSNILFPPEPYDTTTNEDKSVFVKYEDNTFYPLYVIHYEKLDEEDNLKSTTNIFIANLDPSYNDSQLKDIFSRFGTVRHANVVIKECESKAYGFVHFTCEDDARSALQMNKRKVGTRIIHVDYAFASRN